MGRGVSKFPSHLTLNQHRGITRSTGAHDRNRTGDLVLTKDVLYRLSYMGLTSSSASNSNTNAGAGSGNRTHVISLEG